MGRKKQRTPVAFEVTVDSLSVDGFGQAELDGRKLLIPGALPGEIATGFYTSARKSRPAHLERIANPSPERVIPGCPYFLSCSGCRLQHLNASAQVASKQEQVLALFAGRGLRAHTILPPIMSSAWGYRRKARLGAKWLTSTGSALVGFRELLNRGITQMDRCEVVHPSIGHRIGELRDLLGELDAREQIPQLEVAVGDDASALVIRHLCELSIHDLGVLRSFGERTGIHLYLQSAGPESVVVLPGLPRTPLHYALPEFDLIYEFEPLDFIQINAEVNRSLVSKAISMLALKREERVLDLFCGLGNFTLALSRFAGDVVGLEGNEALVAKAERNAQNNGCLNTQFHTVDLFDEDALGAWMARRWDAVVLDPPRSGAHALIEKLRDGLAERILYVSCNPQTLARDADSLVNRGCYRLSALGVIDMFPHTDHVESLALFELRSAKRVD